LGCLRDDISISIAASDINSPLNQCCAPLNIFILLTVICSWTIYTEHIVAFPLQQWLRGRAAMLCYTYVAYFVHYIKVNSYVCLIKLTYTHTLLYLEIMAV